MLLPIHPLFFDAVAPGALPLWRRWALSCARIVAVWLVLAQIVLPMLGHMHEQAHGMAAAQVDAVAMPQSSAALHDLFGMHSKLDCQTFDHQAFGQPMVASEPALLLAAYAPVMVAALQALLLRQSPALYLARGPPV